MLVSTELRIQFMIYEKFQINPNFNAALLYSRK